LLPYRIGFFVHPIARWECFAIILFPYALFGLTVFIEAFILSNRLFFAANSLLAGIDTLKFFVLLLWF